MDISKKSLALSIVTVFVCIAVAVVCLIVMKFDWVSIALSAVIVALAVYVCVFCYLVARSMKKNAEQNDNNNNK